MTIEIIYTRSDLVASHRAAVDAVIAERVYLGRLALPAFDPGTAFLLKHLANNWPTYCAVANEEVVGWADITPVDIPECAHSGMGFFTTRWVFAESATAAGAIGVHMVEAEEKFRRLTSTTESAPILEAMEISESDPATRADVLPGYALYREGT